MKVTFQDALRTHGEERIRAYCYHIMRKTLAGTRVDPGEAEDFLHTSFLNLTGNYKRGDRIGEPKLYRLPTPNSVVRLWLRTARREFFKHLRKQKPLAPLELEETLDVLDLGEDQEPISESAHSTHDAIDSEAGNEPDYSHEEFVRELLVSAERKTKRAQLMRKLCDAILQGEESLVTKTTDGRFRFDNEQVSLFLGIEANTTSKVLGDLRRWARGLTVRLNTPANSSEVVVPLTYKRQHGG